MYTLKQFELQISDKIIHRGREYYENAAVVGFCETGKGFWHAEVMGTETYEVEVELFRKDKIKSYSCDCPYDGAICKHVVAVLFLLREEIINTAVPKKVTAETDFSKLLQKISLEEYQEFILAYAARDENFKSLFERHFANKDNNIDVGRRYTELLKSLIRDNSNRGFIDYRSVVRLAKEINGLLDEGRQYILKGNFSNAFIVLRAVLTEIIELITYCDDSGGYIGDIINSTIEMIMVVSGTEDVSTELQKEIFDFVQSAIKRPIYFDYGDFGYRMADVYQVLAVRLKKEDAYLNFIDGQIKAASADKHSYQKDYFVVRKIAFLKAIGNIGEAQKLLQKNLDIVNVRRGEVSSLIEEGDWSSAKKLIAEGIEIASKKDHPGTVADWQKELLRIAVLEKDTSVVRHYTKYFAFNRGFNTGYYNQWKDTFTINEWKGEIEKYIEERITDVELKYQKNKGKAWYSTNTVLLDLLAPVYIEEKYWDRLLALMSNETDLDRLLQYHDYMVKVYPVQLLAIYLPAFGRKGDVVGNRREYSDLAIKMDKVIKDIPKGKNEIIAVAEELIRKYPRRPAMIEELKKVIK
ncbi:SWIM zinc finger family protein [Chitinophaga tropicalis]|uniref:SWIM-type domain-containing protein n=1 Tax=Chitinophaga tropicalis TaxID=2683588 RepID=A0A7K1UCB3_9BACT|nr:SWIM zinc finger family protein [Chitinophaga tropicalis]MVT11993.1 hypothetical protein [Chitinophaga tropicalis]